MKIYSSRDADCILQSLNTSKQSNEVPPHVFFIALRQSKIMLSGTKIRSVVVSDPTELKELYNMHRGYGARAFVDETTYFLVKKTTMVLTECGPECLTEI